MVQNTSSLILNNLEGQEDTRRTIKNLEKAGVCMPGAGLVYVVSVRDFEDFDHITAFSERIAGEINILSEKILIRLQLRLLLLSFVVVILSYLAIFWPGVMKQHEAVLTILMSKAGPTLVVLYIWRELIDGAVYAKWKTIKHDRLELVRRVNDARRRLPVVAWIIADGVMVSRTNLLNRICYSIVTRSDPRMRFLLWDCGMVIYLGLLNCTFLICLF